MSSTPQQAMLFVLGMHRSGTSALCAALQACGGSFGTALLAPMTGVNDEGFWEDAEVVALNETLLEGAGEHWYTISTTALHRDWVRETPDAQRQAALDIIRRGFGDGRVGIIKDPRLCITLPLWLSVCAELGVAASVCVIGRAPLEVAQSLYKRDGLPLGYGLRLYSSYRQAIAANAPADAVYVSYRELLDKPVATLERVVESLPLQVDSIALNEVVRVDLRHQQAGAGKGLLHEADDGQLDPGQLGVEIAAAHPLDATLSEFATSLVERGVELTRIGEAHTAALATLAQRDQEMDALAEEHRQALATIAERDAQIRDFDQRLTETGEHLGKALAVIDELNHIGELHTHALEVIRDKDAHLQRVLNTPGMGLVFRAMWKRAGR